MYGAILGDMIGAPYEFDQGEKIKDFGPLFINRSRFTDDSVMTIAVAEALMDTGLDAGEKEVKSAVVKSMQKWGHRYPDAGYGGRFIGWLADKDPKPYGSWGNGSAMRVSSVGWLYDTIEKTREVARWTAEVTHNHPEGVKGAESTAAAIFLARNGKNKDEIKKYIIDEFGYDLSRTCDEIRPSYHHVMAAITICIDFGAPKIKSVTVSTVSPSISHEVMVILFIGDYFLSRSQKVTCTRSPKLLPICLRISFRIPMI